MSMIIMGRPDLSWASIRVYLARKSAAFILRRFFRRRMSYGGRMMVGLPPHSVKPDTPGWKNNHVWIPSCRLIAQIFPSNYSIQGEERQRDEDMLCTGRTSCPWGF